MVYCDNRALSALFKDHELNLLKAFANQAAVAIENARLFEAARAQLAEITEMRDLMDNIFTSIVSGLITLDGRQCDHRLQSRRRSDHRRDRSAMRSAHRCTKCCPVWQAFSRRNWRGCAKRVRRKRLRPKLMLDGRRISAIWNIVMSPLRDMRRA